jgi:signal peptidase I
MISLVAKLLLSLAFLGGGAALASRAGVRRFEVEGRSMYPAYRPGDRVVVLRSRAGRPVRRGDVVVVEQVEGRRDLKRVAAAPGDEVSLLGEERHLGADEWYVLGDNGAESTDSRQLGPVKTAQIVGRVLFRY